MHNRVINYTVKEIFISAKTEQMRISQKLIEILRTELNGNDCTDDDLSADEAREVYSLAMKHNVQSMAADWLLKHGVSDETVFEGMATSLTISQWTDQLISKAASALNDAGIEFMFLKGAVIRNDYPEPWMRMSGDIDILVHEQDKVRAREVLCRDLALESSQSAVEDTLVSKGGVMIDLASMLIDKDHKWEEQSSLSDIWNHALPGKLQYERVLCDDMRYTHAVMHMARHFDNGGCGINHVMDLWVLNHRISVTDEMRAARNALLNKKGIKKIEEAFVAVSEKWFSGADVPTMDGLEDMIINGSAHGNPENTLLTKRGKYGKLGYKLSRLFVPYNYLKQLFPSLDGHRWMTPFYEVYRWIYHMKNGRTSVILDEFKKADAISDALAEKTRKNMKELFG